MSGPSVGFVIALIDALDQAGGGPGIVDRFDEKALRYIRESPGRGGQGSFRWNPYGSKGAPSRRGGGPSRRSPTRRSRYRSGAPRGSHRKYWSRSGRRRRKGFYWSHKHKRWMKSKYR